MSLSVPSAHRASTVTTMPTITAFHIAVTSALNPSTHGEIKSQMLVALRRLHRATRHADHLPAMREQLSRERGADARARAGDEREAIAHLRGPWRSAAPWRRVLA